MIFQGYFSPVLLVFNLKLIPSVNILKNRSFKDTINVDMISIACAVSAKEQILPTFAHDPHLQGLVISTAK